MKKLVLISLLVLVLVAAAVPMNIKGVIADRHGTVVLGTVDCHKQVVAQYVKPVGKTLVVTLVGKPISGRACDGARAFAVVVAAKKFSTVIVNGKTFKP